MLKQTKAPRWRGFNLLGMFCSEHSAYNRGRSPGYYCEEDFKLIRDFGFDYVRLPLSYRIWSDINDPFHIDEQKFAPLDDAVYWGQKYGLHVNIAFHRAPGYCVNRDETPEETLDLWNDNTAKDAFRYQWCTIAARYAHISSDQLTFDLLNEPSSRVSNAAYSSVIGHVVNAVREISPTRTFVIDGLNWGDLPPLETVHMEKENIIYSCRGYLPRGVTHYLKNRPEDHFPTCWPNAKEATGDGFLTYNRASLERHYDLWAAVAQTYDVGVFCGEFGCANRTPHDVTLAWMEDLLSVLKERNIGWAMWNLHGMFGVFNSNRDDVVYEKIGGHLLDRKMMNLLQKY